MHAGRCGVDDGWLDCDPEGALDGVGINYFYYLANGEQNSVHSIPAPSNYTSLGSGLLDVKWL